MSLRKRASSTATASVSGSEILEDHEIKYGQLLKRHRHKNTWISRNVVLDITSGTLSYYKPKTHIGRVKSKISRSISRSSSIGSVQRVPSDGDVKSDGESEMKRQLPVCNLHVCILDTEDHTECEAIGQGRILTVSYCEATSGTTSGNNVSTRSIFFKSEKEAGSEEADEEIEEWLTAILKVKESGEGQEDAKTELSTSKHDCLLSADDALAEDREEKIRFDPVHCGWIYKKGSQLSSKWQKRWLFLDCSTLQLRYYKSPMDALPQGEIALDKCMQVKKGMPDLFPEINPPNTFTVVCKERSYWIRTDSPDATQEWIDLLEVCIVAAGNAPPSVRSKSFSMRARSATTSTPKPRRLTMCTVKR
ncbi:uncharacterized protein LOC135824949 isoform X1 [Sycon ciliatum]|uniref:uncharacterized protein LOC135824949 isoform X1 n=1 Tax=Sycon ciliatum TaxID=27933 RepID=UPI0020A95206|eukprot:scpid80453/ scgid0733/ Pleckstrin homology domain-containing family H member 1